MKYIIDIEDEYSMNEGGMKYYQCKQVPYWSVSHGIIKNLTPYTEPDRKAIEDEVWEFVKKMEHEIPVCYLMDIYGDESEIYQNFTYQEAKTKYEAWKKKKEEIRVGDEVEQITASGNPVGFKCVVTKIVNDEILRGITQTGEGVTCSSQIKRWWRKTGRHFPEVEELLKKIKGKEKAEESEGKPFKPTFGGKDRKEY